MTDEAALTERLKQGDEDAFREIVDRHRAEVYRLARGMVRDHDDADEVAQRTFINVYRKIGDFEGRSSLRTWILRIAVNQAKNQIRAGRRTTGFESVEQTLPDPAPPVDERLDRRRRWRRVAEAVKELPRLQKEILTLRSTQGLSYAEIAEVVGCTPGSAKVNYHHAVKKLRARFSEEP